MMTLIAKSKEKERVNGPEGTYWWKEYRVTFNESDECYYLEYCFFSRLPSGEVVKAIHIDNKLVYHDWRVWSSPFATFNAAVMDCAGDSDYMKSDSLHEAHREMVNYYQKCWELAELKNKKDELTLEYRTWKFTEQMLFNKKTKDKSPDKVATMLAKRKLELKPQHDKYVGDIAALQEQIETFSLPNRPE